MRMIAKLGLAITICLCSVTQYLTAEPPVIVDDTLSLEILTPSLKDKKNLKLRLPNGLEAYLISDPDAVRSAAALAVNVGSWQDPKDQPGLAHFLEHMLFLGTTKYPEESGYDRFINENGGSMNAYTAADHTNYMFAIKHEAYPEALDRFAWFFREPLFNPSGVDREVNAIDQEYAKNVEDDHVRQVYVMKYLANPEHPYQHFGMGNKRSLAHANPEILRKFYKEHYSADLMHLVLYSNRPLDELKTLVTDLFSAVPNTGAPLYHTEQNMLPKELHHKVIYVSPIKDLRNLSITWELPGRFAHKLETQPENLISSILGHEDDHSLLAQLKREELAEGLSCGGSPQGRDNFLFQINVQLTDRGVRNIDTVLERTFQALVRLKEKEVPAYLFDENRKMAEMRYQYQSRQDAFYYVMKHSRQMLYEDLETYPVVTEIPQRFDPEGIKDFLNHLTIDEAFLMVTAKPSLTRVTPNEREPWIGVDYVVQALDRRTIDDVRKATAHEAIDLPQPNPFIPDRLEILSEGQAYTGTPHPDLIVNSDQGQVYFLQDSLYQVPEVQWQFTFRTPAIQRGKAKDGVLADLYSRALSEKLNSLSYTASLAGLQFGVQPLQDGITLTVQGYSEKANDLFKAVCEQLTQVHPTEQEFRIYRNSLRRQYQNYSKEKPVSQALHQFNGIIHKKYTLIPDKAKAIRKISLEDLNSFTDTAFQQCYVEGILVGNMTQEQAKQAWSTLASSLSSQAWPKSEQERPRVLVPQNEGGPFYYSKQLKRTGNAVVLMVHNSDFSFSKRAAQQILGKAIHEPFYSALRTQQQTGYIVSNWVDESELQLYSYFALQSNTHNTRDLLARFELSIESFLREIGNGAFVSDRFEAIKDSFVSRLEQPPRNLQEMAALLNTLAFTYDGDFDWMEKRLQGFYNLDYPKFQEYAQDFLGRHNRRRVALLVDGIIPTENQFSYRNAKSATKIRQLGDFQERMPACLLR